LQIKSDLCHVTFRSIYNITTSIFLAHMPSAYLVEIWMSYLVGSSWNFCIEICNLSSDFAVIIWYDDDISHIVWIISFNARNIMSIFPYVHVFPSYPLDKWISLLHP
jgi:hypothetical protein